MLQTLENNASILNPAARSQALKSAVALPQVPHVAPFLHHRNEEQGGTLQSSPVLAIGESVRGRVSDQAEQG